MSAFQFSDPVNVSGGMAKGLVGVEEAKADNSEFRRLFKVLCLSPVLIQGS